MKTSVIIYFNISLILRNQNTEGTVYSLELTTSCTSLRLGTSAKFSENKEAVTGVQTDPVLYFTKKRIQYIC